LFSHALLSLSCFAILRYLPSFPTRRSSDLPAAGADHRLLHRRVLLGEGTRRADRRGPGAAHRRRGLGVREVHPACDRLGGRRGRSEEHTSELQSRENLVCRLLLEKKKEKLR